MGERLKMEFAEIQKLVNEKDELDHRLLALALEAERIEQRLVEIKDALNKE